MSALQVDFPAKLGPLFREPRRYKGAFGGRGGAKSHFFAEMAVLKAFLESKRIVCIREVQNTIRDSVRQLLIDKIQKFGLGSFFEVLDSEIKGQNGSLIIFKGMQSYNAESIKSLEGFDIAWVEEAQSLSDVSLRMLRPTIRNEGSEIWFTWNPRHDTDAVDKFLRGVNKPSDALVVEVNWQDNPWLPEVLKKELDADYAADPEMAEHVWGGGYEIVSEGSYYARALIGAERDGRIGHFPPNPNTLVKTAWDIGVDDYTAVWFVQDDGLKATVVDYYETSNEGADDIIATCMPEVFIPPKQDNKFDGWSKEQALEHLQRDKPFKYGTHYFPHDIKPREWGGGARSRVESVIAYGIKGLHKGVPANPSDRIQAVRRILPVVRFNKTTRVELGLKRLRRYRRKWNDALQTYTEPERDENTHGADAFGEYAINCGLFPPAPPKPKPTVTTRQPTMNELHAEMDRAKRYIGNRI